MGVPSGDATPNGAAAASEDATAQITVLFYNACRFPSPPIKFEMKFETNESVRNLRQKLAEKLEYKADAFDLLYGGKKLVEEDKTLRELTPHNKVMINISRRQTAKDSDFGNDKKMDMSSARTPITSSSSGHNVSPSSSPPSSSQALVPYAAASSLTYGQSYGPTVGPMNYGQSRDTWMSSYTDWNKKSNTGFVGLSNQGATCYMNSLIQTLFMTPEFRAALYKWDFNSNYKTWVIAQEHQHKMEVEQNKSKDDEQKPKEDGQTPSKVLTSSSSGKAKTPEEIEQEKRTFREKESIPRQLQLLFARLQLRDQRAVKTKDLTNSFGWKDSDASTQHDVQELCRVLFDALEKVLKGTEQENLINELYQGEMKDYVKCKECGYESSKKDKFLDIPLVIRGFGATRAVRSVEEAMAKFTQPEFLVEDNQYKCEKCNKKVDAIKGLSFVSFPYLLTLQLKRFDFDYDTFRRIKLNDRVTFPNILDMNQFLDEDVKKTLPQSVAAPTLSASLSVPTEDEDDTSMKKRRASDGEDQEMADVMDAESGSKSNGSREPMVTERGDDDDDDSDNDTHPRRRPGAHHDKDEEDGEELDDRRPFRAAGQQMVRQDSFGTQASREDSVAKASAHGPYVYELYSVLVHRGSALGGHYYAYIKSFETGKWYDFNDSQVNEISEEEIKRTFGDDPNEGYRSRGGMFQMFHSSANAYMLMYRRIDEKRNKSEVTKENVPTELRDRIQDENIRYKKKIEEKEREREMVTLKLHYQGQEKTIKVHNSTTLAETTRQCGDAFNVLSKYPENCIRIRNYQAYNDFPAEPYDDPNSMNKTLDELHFYSQKTLLVETREPSETFPEYNPSDMLLRVVVHDRNTNKFSDTHHVYVDREANLLDLKKVLETKFNIPLNRQRLVRESQAYNGPPAKIIEGDEEGRLRTEHRVYEASKVYLEYCEDPDSASPSFSEIERTKNLIELKYNLPGKDEFDQVLQVSKKLTFGDLKRMIQQVINVPFEEFKVSRGNISWKFELKNESETLEDCRLIDGSKLIVEKGKPMKEGETKLHFHLFDPFLKRGQEYMEDLFEIPIQEEIQIADLKVFLAQQLKELKNIEMDPKFMRIREMFTKSPSTIYPDGRTLKDSANCLYNGKALAVQELPEPDQPKGEDDVAFFLQQWFPAKFETGTKLEMILREDMPIDQFKKSLSEKYNIKNVGIAKAYGSWPGPDLLEVPDLDWDREIPRWSSSNIVTGTLGSAPLYLRDGDILFFRDNDEEAKKLSTDEKRKMEKNSSTKKRNNYYSREEALTINAKG